MERQVIERHIDEAGFTPNGQVMLCGAVGQTCCLARGYSGGKTSGRMRFYPGLRPGFFLFDGN